MVQSMLLGCHLLIKICIVDMAIGANFSGATSGTINSLNNIINIIIIHYNHVNVIT